MTEKAIVGSAHWQACARCIYNDDGCLISADQFEYDPIEEGFVCCEFEEKEVE